jgi:hypothetical protein
MPLSNHITNYGHGQWEGGGASGTSVRGPESQEGTCESPKYTISLAIYVLFYFFPTFCWYFQLFLVYLEK